MKLTQHNNTLPSIQAQTNGDINSNVHLPISFALTATGLLSSVTNFFASRRISMMLFSSANKGASGKDATNKVTNPN